jgi:competence protein ComEC
MWGLGSGRGLRIAGGADKAVTDLADIAAPIRRGADGLWGVLAAQRGALMPWSAVMLGLGIAAYFALPVEPGPLAFGLVAMVMGLGLWAAIGWREAFGPLGMAVALVALGVLAAGYRSHSLAAPMLEARYYGPVEGRVVGIDRSSSDAVRLTLDRVRLDDLPPEATPSRVRVALHGAGQGRVPPAGATIMLTGHLAPPAGAAEPGGFDFQHYAYFLSLGGVGYTRSPVVLLAAPDPGEGRLFALRMRISAAIQARIAGQPGAFAAAVLTGDRSGLEAAPTQAMRDANIAHLLAISGLHMGLLTGFVFAALRLGLALVPALALRYPIRKWAAAGALAAGAFYLALSGGNVATERAFIQVAVMFAAVMLDRRAITMRSVAIAAVCVLLNRPETLMSPGFQMSFAATAALVGAFAALRGRPAEWGIPVWARGGLAVVVSSVVAGAATAPFAAAHFNQVATYGLLANLVTVPVMGSIIMPGAVIAAALTPLGLAAPVWAVMEWALIWILGVAEVVAAWPGAVTPVQTPPGWMLGAVAMAAIWVLLWQGRWRWLGVLPLLVALASWNSAARPLILVADTGGLVGVMVEGQRSLSRARGDGFVAGVWLENDGDSASQEEAAARPGWQAEGGGQRIDIAGISLWHGRGQAGLAGLQAACAAHRIVVIAAPAPAALGPARALPPVVPIAPASQCLLIDADLLASTGALALRPTAAGLSITTAALRQGDRPWSPPRR